MPAVLRRWLPWAVMAVALAVGLSIATFGSDSATTAQDRVEHIASQLKCPQCRGETVADSQASSARAIKVEIAKRVEEGQSDDQILAYVFSRYSDVALAPPKSGTESLVWVLPVVVVVGAVAALIVVFRRWRISPDAEVTDEDRALVAAALAADGDVDGDGGQPVGGSGAIDDSGHGEGSGA